MLSAALEWPDQAISVVLRDLSEHGALIETTQPLEWNAKLYFCRNELRVPAHVAWTEGRFAGIAFARPLKAEVVLRHITRPIMRAPNPALFRRPGFNRLGEPKD